MMLLRWRWFTALSLGGALVSAPMACGDEAGTAPNPTPDAMASDAEAPDAATSDATQPPPPTAVEAFCQGTLGLYAPKYEACCAAADAPDLYKFDDFLYKAIGQACPTTLGKSIQGGRVSLVADKAATCETNLRARVDGTPCPDFRKGPSNQQAESLFYGVEGCSEALVGKQVADAPCANDYECVDGLTCIGWTPDSDGVCKAPPGMNSPCGHGIPDGGFADILRWGFGEHPRCAAGLHCPDKALTQAICLAQQPEKGACDSDQGCLEGLRCQLGVCGTAGPVASGAPCEKNSDCQDRLHCADGEDVRRCAPREAAGASCSGALGTECLGACVEVDGGAHRCVAYCGSQ